jgi:hypothetical protein
MRGRRRIDDSPAAIVGATSSIAAAPMAQAIEVAFIVGSSPSDFVRSAAAECRLPRHAS